jgi:hypothetical protein
VAVFDPHVELARMAALRPIYLPPDPASMITGYARWASALLVPSRRAEDLTASWIAVGIGRVSRCFDCQLEVVPVDLDLT